MIYELKNAMPAWLEPAVIQQWYAMRSLARGIFGGGSNFCPICECSVRFFLPHKWSKRHLRVVCPICLSHPRHRQAWLFFKEHTNLFDASAKRFLHFAPETIFVQKFRSIPSIEYLSIDLDSPHAMRHMDITSLDIPDNSFDAIYCSHLLEHVPDDRKAMREMFRVLRPGAWAVVQVPVSESTTHEDPSITDPRERLRLFGQCDHVRVYGLDITQRLRDAGFDVRTTRGSDFTSDGDCERFGFPGKSPLFFCIKNSSPNQKVLNPAA